MFDNDRVAVLAAQDKDQDKKCDKESGADRSPRRQRSDKPGTDETGRKPYPPDSIPDPMPGVDPQQTPGTDRQPATWR